MQPTHDRASRCAEASGMADLPAALTAVPFLASMAPPPEFMFPPAGCAAERVGFHPMALASLLAAASLSTDATLVSWVPRTSATDLFRIAAHVDFQELPFEESTAHSPSFGHHRSAMDPTSGQISSLACPSKARSQATFLLEGPFFLLPSMSLHLLALRLRGGTVGPWACPSSRRLLLQCSTFISSSSCNGIGFPVGLGLIWTDSL